MRSAAALLRCRDVVCNATGDLPLDGHAVGMGTDSCFSVGQKFFCSRRTLHCSARELRVTQHRSRCLKTMREYAPHVLRSFGESHRDVPRRTHAEYYLIAFAVMSRSQRGFHRKV